MKLLEILLNYWSECCNTFNFISVIRHELTKMIIEGSIKTPFVAF